MNPKSFKSFIIAVLTVMTAACLLCGCSGDLENEYVFPEEKISYTVSGSDLYIGGFSDLLCVPDEDGDFNTDGVDGEAFALFSLDEEKVLSQQNIYKKMYPASTTKILTALIALKYCDPDEYVVVPEEARISVSGSSMAGLTPGDTLTMRDLLYAMMVPSGNDAAVAIAHHISGSTEEFAELMNEEARSLGATHSHFVNPNGLPDNDHYTTVYDMYLIFNEAIKYEDFRTIASTYSYSCTINDREGSANEEKELSWTSGNAFLSGKFSFADGMDIIAGKTGHTNAAGFCLVLGECDDSGNEYISIIFNSYIYEELYVSMRNLAAKSA